MSVSSFAMRFKPDVVYTMFKTPLDSKLVANSHSFPIVHNILLLLNECCPHQPQSPILTALASERWILTMLTTFILPQFLHHIFVDLYWVGNFNFYVPQRIFYRIKLYRSLILPIAFGFLF